MKALVLTYDRYRPLTEHMLATFEHLWPDNPFTFIVPYQDERRINVHMQRVEMIRAGRDILSTVDGLLGGIPDDEWVYWCIDDKFVLAIDSAVASYFAKYVETGIAPHVTGLCFCRARNLLLTPHVSESAVATTTRGHALLRRYNYNQIWLHQLVRARVLRGLFAGFPRREFAAIEMDTFTRQGQDALPVPHTEVMYVTQQNFLVLGESTAGQRITRGCLESMTKWGLDHPDGFEIHEARIVIGSLGAFRGD